MPTIAGTGLASDFIDVTDDVGTLNGVQQGSSITEVTANASNFGTTQLTISNSTISNQVQQQDGFLDADIRDSSINELNLSDANSNIDLVNVDLTHGGLWGAGNRIIDWQGGVLAGDIRSGAGNDIVTMQDMVIADNVTIQASDGDDVWTFTVWTLVTILNLCPALRIPSLTYGTIQSLAAAHVCAPVPPVLIS